VFELVHAVDRRFVFRAVLPGSGDGDVGIGLGGNPIVKERDDLSSAVASLPLIAAGGVGVSAVRNIIRRSTELRLPKFDARPNTGTAV
jgi:hypothetical protein